MLLENYMGCLRTQDFQVLYLADVSIEALCLILISSLFQAKRRHAGPKSKLVNRPDGRVYPMSIKLGSFGKGHALPS